MTTSPAPGARVRRQRGTPITGTYFRLTPDVKRLIDDYADAAQVPTWAIVEAAVRAAQPGPDGVPVGWDLPETVAIPMFDLEEAETQKSA